MTELEQKNRQSEFESLMQKDKKDLVETVLNLQRQLRILKTTVFGHPSKSEKNLQLATNTSQLEFQWFTEEEKKEAEEKIAKIEEEEKQQVVVKSHTRKKTNREQINTSNLPEEVTVVEPAEISNENRDNYVKVGEEVSKCLVVVPKRVYIQKTVRPKYALKSSLQKPDENPIVIAPLQYEVFPKSMASASVLADILIQKYQYHLPFHRVIQQYKESGVLISSSTINDWFNTTCDLLRPIYNELRKKILKCIYIHCDETYEDIYDSESHKVITGYLWAMCEGNGNNIVFIYELGKKDKATSLRLLSAYSGALQTDCNSIYNKFESSQHITTLACWAHARRYWVKALEEDKEVSSNVLTLINHLYHIEHDAIIQHLSPEERYKLRQDKSVKTLEALADYLEKLDLSCYALKSPVMKAAAYTINHFKKLKRYVDDGNYSIDNNKIESLIRPLKIGLNGYQYFHNHDAAYRSAIIYSLIGTCNAWDINPREWFEDVLPKLARIDYSTEEGKIQTAMLLPEQWKKSHPDSHSVIEHMTEEEHIATILKNRAKREKEQSSVITAAN